MAHSQGWRGVVFTPWKVARASCPAATVIDESFFDLRPNGLYIFSWKLTEGFKKWLSGCLLRRIIFTAKFQAAASIACIRYTILKEGGFRAGKVNSTFLWRMAVVD
jgi:hypothetical protein